MPSTADHGQAERLSEKTIEINFCSQVTKMLGHRPIWWYGLTQAKEAELGWDVGTKTAGWWALFQIKASNRLRKGVRRFQTAHHQLTALKENTEGPGEVFYVLPTIGNNDELVSSSFDLLSNVCLLDLAEVPEMGPPTTATGTLRKTGIHYLDLDARGQKVTIHSDPVDVPVWPFSQVYERMTSRRSERRSAERRLPDTEFERRRQRQEAARRFVHGARHRVAAFLPD